MKLVNCTRKFVRPISICTKANDELCFESILNIF
jgi:hypothetical protein